MDIRQLKQSALKEISQAKGLKSLEDIKRKYLGRKGELRAILQTLKELPFEKRRKQGKIANQIKQEIENLLEKKLTELTGVRTLDTGVRTLDVTAPGVTMPEGHLHPITQIRRKVEDIFTSMGFEVVEGPEIETEYYHFDALNFPKEHPARDLMDTFWLARRSPRSGLRRPTGPEASNLLLRAHTSPMQVRYMEKHHPPLRIIVPGRCFRHEATDASHEHTFYQVEGLMVGEDVSLANLKGVLFQAVKRLFGEDVKIRLRPGYFPFVEPGFELDVTCTVCKGKGCSVCKRSGWVEVIPCGMVHPNVFKAVGYNPGHWQGFAFGMGLDRITMMKYRIEDIRLFHSGDLRFLEQF